MSAQLINDSPSVHTRGPWFVYRRPDQPHGAFYILDTPRPTPQTAQICEFHLGSHLRSPEESLANARLIAAAPRLLVSLSRLINAVTVEEFQDATKAAWESFREAKGISE